MKLQWGRGGAFHAIAERERERERQTDTIELAWGGEGVLSSLTAQQVADTCSFLYTRHSLLPSMTVKLGCFGAKKRRGWVPRRLPLARNGSDPLSLSLSLSVSLSVQSSPFAWPTCPPLSPSSHLFGSTHMHVLYYHHHHHHHDIWWVIVHCHIYHDVHHPFYLI